MTNRFWICCSKCGETFHFNDFRPKCTCGSTLLVQYDLDRVSKEFAVEGFPNRSQSLWRYSKLLPVTEGDPIITLGEGCTPLVPIERLSQLAGVKEVFVKREEQNPTGSFKARGMSVAVSLVKAKGIRKVAIASNGNAAAATAAYSVKAEIEAHIFLPKDCPGRIVEECRLYGAHTFLVDGLIHDAARIIEEGKKEEGWFNLGTLQEPGRIEGKKTMGYELAEAFGWELPDVVIYPTGGGSGLIGMWKAFKEMKQLGIITGDLPRLIAVQESGCQPVVNSFHEVNERSSLPAAPTGMRVPLPPDLDLIISIIKETNGTAIAVKQDEIMEAQALFGKQGISASPEGSATLAALLKLKDKGHFRPGDRVVLFNTSHAMKYATCDLSHQDCLVVKDYFSYRSQFGLALHHQ